MLINICLNISRSNKWSYLAKISAKDELYKGSPYKDTHFKLIADIDLGGKEWTPIGTLSRYRYFFRENHIFSGIFDGNARNISNLTIKTPIPEAGLFGTVVAGSIKNLKLDNIYIAGGFYSGTIVAAGIDVTISDCTAEGIIKGIHAVGGILGVAYKASLNGSKVSADIAPINAEGMQHLIYSGIPSDMQYGDFPSFGGIIGGLEFWGGYSQIKNCIAQIKVKGVGLTGGMIGKLADPAEIVNCTVVGDISGGRFTGGLIGGNRILHENIPSYIKNCIFKGNIQGAFVGSLAGNFWGSIENCSVSGNLKADKSGGFVGFQRTGILMPKYSSVWLNEHAGENAGIKELWGTTTSGTVIMLTSPSTRYIKFSPSPPISIQRSAKIPDGVSFDLGDTGFEVIPRNFVGVSLDVAGRYLVISGTTVALEGDYQIFAVKSPDVLVIPLDIF